MVYQKRVPAVAFAISCVTSVPASGTFAVTSADSVRAIS
jgi:hypothetical protein